MDPADLPWVEQGTPGWFADRAGHVTASRICDVLAEGRKKGTEGRMRRAYRVQLVTERLMGRSTEEFGYRNAAMDRGKETESLARMAYEAATGAIVVESSFVRHPRIKWVGSSPDGLVDDDGMIEIKCPDNPCIHMSTVINGKMPEEHEDQVFGNLWVTGRKWCDFISFDPRMPPHLQLFVDRIDRNNAYIEHIEVEVVKFLAEVEVDYQRLARVAA